MTRSSLHNNTKDDRIHWRSILNIRWDQELITDVKQYLKDKSLPTRLDTGNKNTTYMKEYRFKKLFDRFSLGDDNKIYVIINEEKVLPSYFLDKDGNLLFDVNLPMKFRVVENDKEKEEIITTYYSNLLGNGYRSATNLHQRLSKEFVNISKKDVSGVLKNIEINQLIRPIEENKIVKPLITEKPYQQWEVDLIDVSSIAKHNDNVNFILTCIDIFSKFVFCEILKNKSAKSVAYAMQQIILRYGSPQIISSDNGSEFVSKEFAELCARFSIKQHFSLPYKPQSQGAVEKFNGTLKNYMFRFLTDHQSKRYVDNLQIFVYSYNTTQHGTTKKTPFEIHFKRHESFKMLENMVHKNITDNAQKMIENSLKNQAAMQDPLELGDKVRVGLLFLKEGRRRNHAIQKKNKQHWSSEVYEIVDIKNDNDLISYKIDIPLKDEEHRFFYRHQLLKIYPENMIKRRNIENKFDYNFGEKFDSELHIKTLAKNNSEKNALEQSQAELVAQQEQEDKKDTELVAQQQEGQSPTHQSGRRSGRQHKTRDHGFFVTF
jgi:hypothetical protein